MYIHSARYVHSPVEVIDSKDLKTASSSLPHLSRKALNNDIPLSRNLANQCEQNLPIFLKIDEISQINTEKVLSAFSECRLSDRHFNPTTGYGYNDDGRQAADDIYAKVFGCEAGFVRHNIISGTMP